MALTNEHVGPMILAKIKIYVFTRAELLFQVCYETPCSSSLNLAVHTSLTYVTKQDSPTIKPLHFEMCIADFLQ